jgi:hypothetical protein
MKSVHGCGDCQPEDFLLCRLHIGCDRIPVNGVPHQLLLDTDRSAN